MPSYNNPELVDSLRTHFVQSYTPTTAWVHAIPAMLMLPRLKAVWPMSSRQNFVQYDLSGQGRALAAYGSPDVGYTGLIPYQILTGGDYLYRFAQAGLPGTGQQSCGGWFYFSSLSSVRPLIAQWDAAAADRCFTLYYTNATSDLRYAVSTTGANSFTANHGITVSTGAWYFIAGVFDASNQVARIFVNGTWGTNSGGTGSGTLFSATEDFRIGMHISVGPTTYTHDGYATLCWYCARTLPHRTLAALYELQRPLFGA